MPRVLLPCDGSANALLAVRHAMLLLRADASLQLDLLNVQPPFCAYIARHSSREDRMDFHREQAEKALAPARALLDAAGVAYRVHMDVGDKASCIVDAAQRLRCDRILVGTARKSSLVRAIEGSLTVRLIERTQVPVEVIAGAEVSTFERLGVPVSIAAGLTLLWMSGL